MQINEQELLPQNTKTMSPSRTAERGQAILEFALVFMVLFFVIVGVFDLGRAFHAVIVITNASREGARYGTRYPDEYPVEVSNFKQAAQLEAQNSGITLQESNVSVICTDLDSSNGCDSGYPVVVTVTYDFEPILKLFLPDSFLLTRSTQMMVP